LNQIIETYLFARPSGLQIKEYAKKIIDVNTILCFDLEDIVKEMPGNATNDMEKQLHRRAVVDTMAILSDFSKNIRIGIRVNVFNSNEFYKDLEVLEELRAQVRLTSIFLPKVESGNEILRCFNLLKEREIEFDDIIAIIESENAYLNLNEIVTVAKDFSKKLAFGHCDFNFAYRHFPFFHQHSEKYWEWIATIGKVTKANNVVFINSPYLFLDDDEGFLWNLKQLNEIVTGSVGQITLTLRQTMLCSPGGNNSVPLKPKGIDFIGSEQMETFAATLISDFEKNRMGSLSFSLSSKKRILISPHEYLAAKEYLKKLNSPNGD